MAKFIFIGDPLDGGRGASMGANGESDGVLRLFGHEFPKGVAVEVTDAHAVAKLSGNRHFVREGDKAPEIKPSRDKQARKVENIGIKSGPVKADDWTGDAD